MALEVLKNGTWTSYTAGTTVLPNARVVHFRDSALAIEGGAATSAKITLGGSAYQILAHVADSDGTITAGTGIFKAVSPGVTYDTNREPVPANDDTSGLSFAISSTADANELGSWVGGCPESFKVRFTGITGTSTTLHLAIEAHMVD